MSDSYTPLAADVGRRKSLKCYVQGSRRRKKTKGVDGGSGRQDCALSGASVFASLNPGPDTFAHIRIWDPEIKSAFSDITLRAMWFRRSEECYAPSLGIHQTCSASPCERNWSTFDNLHSKKRNCLLQQKLNDLVFIQYNTRLQRRFESIKTNKSLDPILLRDVEENDEWTIPTENELQDFVNAGDELLWSDVREAMGGNVDVGPSTRSKRERYRDDDDEIDVGVGLEEEVNALDDVDSDAEPLDCN
ncbi:zinc finger protein [Tanacetum coccineum]|uniref:Zinc finger protein n=1 Tax=Tanacetum coccineum TaxID=301880 RepID=A0ABQ5DUQ9_9ASTR